MPIAIAFSLIFGWRVENKNKSRIRKWITSYGVYALENYLVNEKVVTILHAQFIVW